MNKKRWALLVSGVALLVVIVLAVQHTAAKRAEQKRELEYRLVLKEYSDALKPGMNRREVETYLRSRERAFRQVWGFDFQRGAYSTYADLVRIGQEKAPWYCSERNIYVAFSFASIEGRRTPEVHDSDRLESISLVPWLEGCL